MLKRFQNNFKEFNYGESYGYISTSLFFDGDEAESLAMQFALESVAKSFAAADAVRADMKWNTGVAVSAAVLAMELWAAA